MQTLKILLMFFYPRFKITYNRICRWNNWWIESHCRHRCWRKDPGSWRWSFAWIEILFYFSLKWKKNIRGLMNISSSIVVISLNNCRHESSYCSLSEKSIQRRRPISKFNQFTNWNGFSMKHGINLIFLSAISSISKNLQQRQFYYSSRFVC